MNVLVLTGHDCEGWLASLRQHDPRVCITARQSLSEDDLEFDVLILDWDVLPERSGRAFAELVADAVVVSERFTRTERERLIRAGATACVTKWNHSELAAVMDRELGRASRRASLELQRDRGRVCGMRGITLDITEQQSAQERSEALAPAPEEEARLLKVQLEQADRLNSLSQLTATVAHEFNNVLMSMQPFVDLLQRPQVTAETIDRAGRHIANSIERGKRVAMDMLRFARPAQPSFAAIDIGEWWKHLAPELQGRTGDSIRFTWDMPPGLTISADAAQLSQVFTNLISNARDAMPNGGDLTVTARRPQSGESYPFGVVADPHTCVHMLVTDTGRGMPEHVMRHVFDPLFTTKKNGGTGLGLAVAHLVVTRHGGLIFVESEVTQGTTFHIFLPLANVMPEPERTAAESDPAVRAQRILIVEDEALIAEGLAEMLRERGMTVVTIEEGGLAEEAARAFKPDVALIDIRLRDMNGLEVGRRLRTLLPSMKIIFDSGHGDASAAIEECAPAAFLQKPFETRAFLEAVATLERQEAS